MSFSKSTFRSAGNGSFVWANATLAKTRKSVARMRASSEPEFPFGSRLVISVSPAANFRSSEVEVFNAFSPTAVARPSVNSARPEEFRTGKRLLFSHFRKLREFLARGCFFIPARELLARLGWCLKRRLVEKSSFAPAKPVQARALSVSSAIRPRHRAGWPCRAVFKTVPLSTTPVWGQREFWKAARPSLADMFGRLLRHKIT